MPSEGRICLIKECPLIATPGYTSIPATDIIFTRFYSPAATLCPVNIAISKYIEELKSRKLHLLALRMSLENRELLFDAYITPSILQELGRILPNPYLQILATVYIPSPRAQMTTLEMRFEIAELLATSEVSKWLRLFTFDSSIGEDFTCDIILGWGESVPNTTTTKMLAPNIPPKCHQNSTRIDTVSFLHSLFERDSSKDLTIVAGGNGAEIRCHRIIFEAHSDVLAAMLSPDNDIQGSETGRIKMSENSEEGLTHLIRYLYGMELKTEELTCDVAIELFKTAHKYKLAELLDWLRVMLLEKGRYWYAPDGLLELYFHVRNLSEFKSLEEHLLSIMLSLTQEISSCERFKELKQRDAEAACSLLLTLFKMK